MEKIADALPGVDRMICLSTANSIVPLLRSIHQYEEAIIFPAYEEAVVGSEANLASTRRLRAEHGSPILPDGWRNRSSPPG